MSRPAFAYISAGAGTEATGLAGCRSADEVTRDALVRI
jgi:hypothetical protein